MTWLHTNVSSWPVTSELSVRIQGMMIYLEYDKAKIWNGIDNVNANPWVFIKQDGKIYAATWEWLRPGQTAKQKKAVDGDHIKRNPLNEWKPVTGETYYFMISGLARDNKRNVQERTNIVPLVWK